MTGIDIKFTIKIEPELIINLYKQSISELGMSKEDQEKIIKITLGDVKNSLIDVVRWRSLDVPDINSVESVLKEQIMFIARKHKDILEMNKIRNC